MQNEKIKASTAIKNIASATVLSFTICVLCWSVFWLLPDAGNIASRDVVMAVWISLAICLCMSVLGFICFSEVFVKKASLVLRYLVFAIVGYCIITAWVFGAGWCPADGFGLFSIICIAVFIIVGVVRLVKVKKSDDILNKQLSNYKQN